MNQVTSSLARAWSTTVGTNAIILLFGIATGIIAARLLGPADRGLFAVVVFWPGLLVGLGNLSLNESIVFRIHKSVVERRRFLSTVTALSFGLTVPVMICGALLLPFLLGPERSEVWPLAMAYLFAFVPVNLVMATLLAIDQAECRFSRYNFSRLFPPGIYLLSVLLLWTVGAISVATVVWATWLGTALTTCVRLWIWRQHLLAHPIWREAKALLRQGVLFHGTTVIMLLSSQADRLIVIRFFGDTDIGQYVVALTIATTGLGLVTNSVHTVLYPLLAAEPMRARAQDRLRLGLQRSTLLLVASSILAIVLIPHLLPLLFGTAYAPAIATAVFLVLAYVPLALRQIIVRCLRAFGDARSGLLVESIALVSFLLLLPFTYVVGLIGIPLALAGANVVGLAVVCVQLQRHHQISTRAWLLPSRAMLSDAAVQISRFHRMTWSAR